MTTDKRIGEIVVEFTRDRSHYSSPTARALFAGWLRTTLTSFAAERDAAILAQIEERIKATIGMYEPAYGDANEAYVQALTDALEAVRAVLGSDNNNVK